MTSVDSFHLALKYTWKISKTSIAFLDMAKFQSMATACLPVCMCTNLLIPTVICCIHPLILPMSKTASRSLNFLDFDVYVVITLIFQQTRGNVPFLTISSRSVAILILLSTRIKTLLNRLIESALQTSQGKEQDNSIYTHLPST